MPRKSRITPGIQMLALLAFSLVPNSCASSSTTPTQATAPPQATPSATAIVPTSTPSPSSDNLGSFRQFVEAVNAGDANRALEVLTDDVIWERGGQCPPGACIGKQAVQREIMRDVANHHAIAIVGANSAGNSVDVRVELQTDGTQRANVERIIQVFSLELKGDKIEAVRVAVDTSDPVTAAFQAAQGR